MDNSKPKVSVVTITYGHEKYIEDTLNGVIMQQYNGPIEFIIANDNSPDETDAVVKKYFETHPVPKNIEIKYTNHPENKGMMPNFIWALQQATGKYIALCEGDDYWTDPLKLQKQVDFLEENEDYAICFHKVIETTEELNLSKILIFPDENQNYNIFDLAKENFIHTPSVILRNNWGELPEWFNYLPIGDYPLMMFASQHGKIKYLKDEMAAYRIGVGIWSKQSTLERIRNTQIVLYVLMIFFAENKELSSIIKNRIENYVIEYNNIVKDQVCSNIYNYPHQISIKNMVKLIVNKFCRKLSFLKNKYNS